MWAKYWMTTILFLFISWTVIDIQRFDDQMKHAVHGCIHGWIIETSSFITTDIQTSTDEEPISYDSWEWEGLSTSENGYFLANKLLAYCKSAWILPVKFPGLADLIFILFSMLQFQIFPQFKLENLDDSEGSILTPHSTRQYMTIAHTRREL